MGDWSKAASVAEASHPRNITNNIAYGTAGFRTKAGLLDHVMYRMGLMAVLRSRAKGGQRIGVMITASHNPEGDNGVKLVDPAGEMLEQSWEGAATNLANCQDQQLPQELDAIVAQFSIGGGQGRVIVGRDTRVSSPALSLAVVEGVKAAGGEVVDIGVVTTPQLHYMVVATNTEGGYGEPSLPGYYGKIVNAFKKFMDGVEDKGGYVASVGFDGANGVGSQAMKEFKVLLEGTLEVDMVNTGEGVLNSGCGADHVKTTQSAPLGLEGKDGLRCVSVDGDADRVIYFYTSGGKFHLLDGDRIATLIAGYLKELLDQAGLSSSVKLGLVQTAYANGASTKYITQTLHVPVSCTPTGVKHLHHKALTEYDIGVYFEANGHGTVVFSEKAEAAVRGAAAGGEAAAVRGAAAAAGEAAAKLAMLIDVVNQTVGDAISDMLLVECILAARGWSAADWNKQYIDFPNKLAKVLVADRTAVTTTDAERCVVTPAGLQDRVDSLVAEFQDGRSFVRPSGTEDVVRVYAEANTRETADLLSDKVCQVVKEMLS